MRLSALSLSAAVAASLAVALSIPAQEPQGPPLGAPPQGAPGSPPREFPKPTNLKVLPKDLTGKQVRDIMEGWEGQLGMHCSTCHTADPKNIGPNGRPRLNFANDSKPEKNAARLMFTMTGKINDDYISMVQMDHDEAREHAEGHEDHADHKVTCGTCHRGHQHPEAYIPPPEHEGPPPPPPSAPQPPTPQ